MRELIIKDIPIKFTEKEYNSLLMRFDYKNKIMWKDKEGYLINKDCIFCKKYEFRCSEDCKLNIFDKKHGCFTIVKHYILMLTGFSKPMVTRLGYQFIYWIKKNDKKAKEQLNKIHKFIKSAERIK